MTAFKVGNAVRITSTRPGFFDGDPTSPKVMDAKAVDVMLGDPTWPKAMDAMLGEQGVVVQVHAISNRYQVSVSKDGTVQTWWYAARWLTLLHPEFQVGQVVTLQPKSDIEIKGQPDWSKKMDRLIGLPATVTSVGDLAVAVITVDGTTWLCAPHWLTPGFEIGQTVQVIETPPEHLQEGPGWTIDMTELCGKTYTEKKFHRPALDIRLGRG